MSFKEGKIRPARPIIRIVNKEVLSPREKEVFSLRESKLKNREIAERLGISKKTVAAHFINIYNKSNQNPDTSSLNEMILFSSDKNLENGSNIIPPRKKRTKPLRSSMTLEELRNGSFDFKNKANNLDIFLIKGLTGWEIEILSVLSSQEGDLREMSEIAAEKLGIKRGYLMSKLSAIYQKLDIHSILDAIILMKKAQWIIKTQLGN